MKRFEGKVALNHYLYIKYKRNKYSYISFKWSEFGIFLNSIIQFMISFKLDAIKGFYSGKRKSKNNYRNLEFIKEID